MTQNHEKPSVKVVFFLMNALCAKINTKDLRKIRQCAKIDTHKKDFFFSVRENNKCENFYL